MSCLWGPDTIDPIICRASTVTSSAATGFRKTGRAVDTLAP